MIGIMNEILAVVAPADNIIIVATTDLLIAVKKEIKINTKLIVNHVIHHSTSKFQPQQATL